MLFADGPLVLNTDRDPSEEIKLLEIQKVFWTRSMLLQSNIMRNLVIKGEIPTNEA